nr:proteinaceous RNase P 2 [Ipomoea batatas]
MEEFCFDCLHILGGRYWLFAAVKFKCLLVTNDEMRDQIFELLGSNFFIRYTFVKGDLELLMPPSFSGVIQVEVIALNSFEEKEEQFREQCRRLSLLAAAVSSNSQTSSPLPVPSQSASSANNMAKGNKSISRPPTPSQFPLLVYFHGKKSNTQTFYDIERDYYEVKKIPDMFNKYVRNSSHGWTLMIDMYMKSDTTCFLLNIASMEKIKLPPWKFETPRYSVLTLPPSDPKSIVAFFREGISSVMFCHPGEKDVGLCEIFISGLWTYYFV